MTNSPYTSVAYLYNDGLKIGILQSLKIMPRRYDHMQPSWDIYSCRLLSIQELTQVQSFDLKLSIATNDKTIADNLYIVETSNSSYFKESKLFAYDDIKFIAFGLPD